MAQAVQRAWILPFGLPPLIKGDHCLLGLDLTLTPCLGIPRPRRPQPLYEE